MSLKLTTSIAATRERGAYGDVCATGLCPCSAPRAQEESSKLPALPCSHPPFCFWGRHQQQGVLVQFTRRRSYRERRAPGCPPVGMDATRKKRLGGCWGWRLLYLSVLGAAGEVGHEAAHVLHCPFADVFQRGAFLAIQKQTSHGACSVRRRGGGGGKKGGRRGGERNINH